jgi:DNA-binding LacI/PurR family transcriptional regulator
LTLKEIAKMAGVSIATVSRVINHGNSNAASKATQDKIWSIVKETGYTPNQNARSLKMGTKASLPNSIEIACIFARVDDLEYDPFFIIIMRAIEQEALLHGYSLRYSFSITDLLNTSTSKLFSNHSASSIVVLGRFNKKVLSLLSSHYKHIVYTGLNILPLKVDQIVSNGHGAAMMAVNHLIELGHRKIYYIGERKDEQRYTGYLEAMSKAGFKESDFCAVDATLSSRGGYQATKNLIENKKDFTALFCANDVIAIGAMKALKEHNIRIPDDVSVIGIDNIDTVQFLTPMLTTIHIPLEELGKMTAKMLIDRIEGGHQLPIKMELPYYLVKRETCSTSKNS